MKNPNFLKMWNNHILNIDNFDVKEYKDEYINYITIRSPYTFIDFVAY